MSSRVEVAATESSHDGPGPNAIEGDGWTFLDGKVSQSGSPGGFRTDDIESLTYNNPFRQGMERVWYDGKIAFALDAGELDIEEPDGIKVAKEYQCVYSVDLDDKGKLKNKEEVDGQLNIYDSVPGMEEYSPIWQFYYVVVPRDYKPNELRSTQACEQSGYTIRKSNVFEN